MAGSVHSINRTTKAGAAGFILEMGNRPIRQSKCNGIPYAGLRYGEFSLKQVSGGPAAKSVPFGWHTLDGKSLLDKMPEGFIHRTCLQEGLTSFRCLTVTPPAMKPLAAAGSQGMPRIEICYRETWVAGESGTLLEEGIVLACQEVSRWSGRITAVAVRAWCTHHPNQPCPLQESSGPQ